MIVISSYLCKTKMCCLLYTAIVIDYFLFNHVTALLMKTDRVEL